MFNLYCLLASSVTIDAWVAPQRIPSIDHDNFRVVVLGDSFSGQSPNRIIPAFASELPLGRVVGWRNKADSFYTYPIRTDLVHENHEVINQQGVSGCRELELDMGGDQWLGLPLGGMRDVRLDAPQGLETVFRFSLSYIDPALDELQSIFSHGSIVRAVGRVPTNQLSPARLQFEPWSTACDSVSFDFGQPGTMQKIAQASCDVASPVHRSFDLNYVSGGDAVQLTDIVMHGRTKSGPSQGIYVSMLQDNSWSYSSYASDSECISSGVKSFTNDEFSSWLAATAVNPQREILFMVVLDTESHSIAEYQGYLEGILSRIETSVQDASLSDDWNLLVVVPMRHKVYATPPSEEAMYFENLWEAVKATSELSDRLAGISLYHYFGGTRFDGSLTARQWLTSRCQQTVTWNNSSFDLSANPYFGDLYDLPEVHPADAQSARFQAKALVRLMRGWSFKGDLNHDGFISSEDTNMLLGLMGTEGVSEADLDGNGLVDNHDLTSIISIINCAGGTQSPDLTGDGVVGFDDLLVLLNEWGVAQENAADLDQNGVVDFSDLLILIASWTS